MGKHCRIARSAGWFLLACMAAGAAAQERRDDPMARARWLYEQRALPTGRIPQQARIRAMQARGQMEREEARRIRISAIERPDQPLASAAQWTFIGPRPILAGVTNQAGRVPALAVHPSDPLTVYAGGAQGGVWKTTDGGVNWTPLTDTQPTLAIGAIAIAASNPNIVYAGTGEQSFSSDSYYGAGVLKSTDGGVTWSLLGTSTFRGPFGSLFTLGGMRIGGLAVHPADPNLVLAAAHRFENQNSGVYRTTDGGVTWTLVLDSVPGTSVLFDPADPTIVYAGTGSIFGGTATNGPGVYRSTNSGQSWTRMAITIPIGREIGRVELAVAKASGQPTVVYAAMQNAADMGSLLGVFKSVDGGANWTQLTVPDFCAPQCWYDMVVGAQPGNPNLVFAGGSANATFLLRSPDGGANWSAHTTGLHVDQHAMAFSSDGAKLYLGNDGGVWRTDVPAAVGSVTWINLNASLGLAQFYSGISAHPSDPNIVFGGTQDNGVNRYSGVLAWDDVACGDGSATAVEAANPNNVFIACQAVEIQKSSGGGLSGTFFPADAGIAAERGQFIPPMVMDPSDGQRLYYGTHRLWRTVSGGTLWEAASPDLTDNIGERAGISTIAVAPSNPDVVYTGSSDGVIQRSANARAALATSVTWTRTADIATRAVTAIAVDPANAATAIATFSGFAQNISGPSRHVYRTTNSGGAWTDISANLPDIPVNAIVIDPAVASTYYIGTDVGVFRSQDAGASWQTMVSGLPNVAVFGLHLHAASRTLRAATHGRGMWEVAVPLPNSVTVTPGTLAFGNVLAGIRRNLAVQVQAGAGGLQISGMVASAGFSQSNDCPATLAANASCTVSVSFAPAAAGAVNGTLTISSNAAGSPNVVTLSGTGVNFTLARARRPARPTGATAVPAGAVVTQPFQVSSSAPAEQPLRLSCASDSPSVRCEVPREVRLDGATVQVGLRVLTQSRDALAGRGKRVGRRSGTPPGIHRITVRAAAGSVTRELTFEVPVR